MSDHKHGKEEKKKPMLSPKEKRHLKQQKKHPGDTLSLIKQQPA